jgi:hypothetical protein
MALTTTTIDTKRPLVYSIVWLIMLVLLSYPLAWFLVWFWVLLMPLEHVFEPAKQLNDLLEKFITWPRMVGKAMWKSEEDFPNPMQQTPKEAVLNPDGDDSPETNFTLC